MSGAMSKQQQEQKLSPQPCNNGTLGQLLLLHQHFISSSAFLFLLPLGLHRTLPCNSWSFRGCFVIF
jgi:hypothetical protein